MHVKRMTTNGLHYPPVVCREEPRVELWPNRQHLLCKLLETNKMNQAAKAILVTGGSGYVGSFILKSLAAKFPGYTLYSVNRSGSVRDESIAKLTQLKTLKGNCLDPKTFEDVLKECDGVVHAVGTLVGKGTGSDPGSQQSLNRDSCIRVAELFDKLATREQGKRFVMISSEKGPPFVDDYIKYKREAEEFLLHNLANVSCTIIRPGFVTSMSERAWSIPLKVGVDMAYLMNDKIFKNLPGGKMLDYFVPARSIELDTVAEAAIQAVNGDIDVDIVSNDNLHAYETSKKWPF